MLALRWVQDEKSGKGVECWADGARLGPGIWKLLVHPIGSYPKSTYID